MSQAVAVPHNLPRELTTLVGRADAVAEVTRLLDKTPLVSLVGVGGAGKTRLAMRVAHDQVTRGGPDSADGVWLVELASVPDPAMVCRALAEILGVAEQPTRALEISIADAIGARQMLLVLDNCEHVIDVCARLAEGLLHAAPGLRVLATSREPLGVGGEITWAVPPLTLPAADSVDAVARSEAGQLFVSRATAARRDFTLSAANAAAVAHLCRQLDGIPLAIELAAARSAALGPADIAARLDDVLRLLVGGPRSAPTRQQSLQAAIEWSYRLLDEREQLLFDRLSVFSAGFDLKAAEAISYAPGDRRGNSRDGTPASVLDRLVSKSLVEAEALADGSMRFRQLEPIRQFARKCLAARGELADAQHRHAAYMLAVAQVGGPALRGPDQLEWHRRLERERDNFRAALDYTVEARDAHLGVGLAAALAWWWTRPDRRAEGRTRLAEALALPVVEGQAALRAQITCALAMLAGMQGDVSGAVRWLELAREANVGLKNVEVHSDLLVIEAMLYAFSGDTRKAREVSQRGRALAHREGLRWLEARHLHNLADHALASGDGDEARALITESLRLAHAAHDTWSEAMASNGLGDVLRSAGDYAQAERAYARAAELFQSIEEQGGMPRGAWAGLPHNLGYVALAQGFSDRAMRYFTDAADRYQRYGPDWRGVAECVMGFGSVAVRIGQPRVAARLFGAAEAALEQLATTFTSTNQADYDRALARLRDTLPADDLQPAWQAGRATGLEQALQLASQLVEPTAPPSPVAELTPRELEVARLVARGLTNREVAERLVITEKTAANHLQHVLDKLDIRSRTHLAAQARELGL